MVQREGFTTRIGFVLAAAGSAVGLGNIWGFPTQAANHGGGAFVLVYLLVILLLAIPALYAELTIGHNAGKNPVVAMTQACSPRVGLGKFSGYTHLVAAVMMLSFYSIVAGWMLAHTTASISNALGFTALANFASTSSVERNAIFTLLIIGVTATIIAAGVKHGIEKWSKRLMPTLFVILIFLIIYVLRLPGADVGLQKFVVPDFRQLQDTQLILSAMGQAFFSLSIGVGGMMIYGSYLSKDEHLGKLTFSIAALDTCVALLAGLLIVPALYAAQSAGAQITQDGELIGRSQLIFNILPVLFNSLGPVGQFLAIAFFSLLTIASVTSTISSTEVPVSYLTESRDMSRRKATIATSVLVAALSSIIVLNFSLLFGAVITVLTHFMLPLMGLFYFIVIGWLWNKGNHLPTNTAKQRWLSRYLKYCCPIMMALVFVQAASQ
ncbi:sodium-dependent transporter [Alteromonadaceae bacterium M269]|nr:sodium-dependent transporter [Alteromonadaceae bacterium M269]